MTYEAFTDYKPRQAAASTIGKAKEIIDEYRAAGFTLTLRQLYYQFVARGLIENTDLAYKKLGKIITAAREGGYISWDAIEDRGRRAVRERGESDPETVLTEIVDRLKIDPWRDQEHYVEVWIEKEALLGVIQDRCDQYRVTRLACKGYLSASTMWSAAKRFQWARKRGKHPVIIHLGDHDPSGLDMTRDNEMRSSQFSWGEVHMQRIALNMNQVEAFDPPPNPAKITDSRSHDYITQHGSSSWELDALDPKTIDGLLNSALGRYITNRDGWDAAYEEEEQKRDLLRQLPERWDDIIKFLGNE